MLAILLVTFYWTLAIEIQVLAALLVTLMIFYTPGVPLLRGRASSLPIPLRGRAMMQK